MDVSRFWLIWPDNPALSLLVVALLAMAFLYAARLPMHQLIRATGHAVGGPLRIASRWLLAAAAEINDRNKAVLLAHGRRELENRVEREFERIATLVNRDLQGYPVLQRKLSDEVTRVEEDYKKCGEVPPPPPDWVEAVAAIGKIKSGGGELATVDHGRDQSVDQPHPRQGDRRVPQVLRGTARDPREVHAVLARHRKDAGAGRQEHQRPAEQRLVGGQPDGAVRADRGQDRQGGARAHGLGADPVRHRADGDDGGHRRHLRQLQADRVADVRDGGRGRLHHGLVAHLARWRRW